MPDTPQLGHAAGRPDAPPWPKTIVIQQRSYIWLVVVLLLMLLASMFVNLLLLMSFAMRSSGASEVVQTHVSGSLTSDDKIALLEVSGTIMPPFTERWIKTIEAISEDDSVKGVVLRIDSPGGLVADSHQIYHALNELREKAEIPIYVSMARIAASGGYYIAMGAGPKGQIFAEPTTWTGSIGVIMPRYNATELAEKVGVASDPLVTGKFKDTLSPLRDMTEEERKLWMDILDDSFVQFKDVILTGRPNLDEDKLDKLATGQVFTANQASENGLVDEIGFQDDTVKALTAKLGLSDPQLVRYEYPVSFFDLFAVSAEAVSPIPAWEKLLGSQVPQALYFCGSPGIGPLQ